MELTKEEFCLFNLKSKLQFVEKDGLFLFRRVSGDQFLISLYKIYDFYIEVTYDIPRFKTTRVDPVVNIKIIELYSYNEILRKSS